MGPKISIIIVTHNGRRYIDKLLNSLAEAIKSCNNAEVIIVDNYSTDGTFERIKEHIHLFDGKLRLFRLSKNLNFSGGNSVGFELSKGELVLLLNQDTYVEADLLVKIAKVFQENPRVGAAQCMLLQYRYPNIIDSCGDSISSIGIGVMNKFGEKLRYVQDQMKGKREICLARGAALIVRRELLNVSKIINGACIPKYFVTGGYEDWYLSLLARSLGYEVVLIPDCRVYHDSLRLKRHDPYILYNALSLFTVLRAPTKMLLGRILISIISLVAMKASPLKFLHAILSFFKKMRLRLKERYIFDRIMAKNCIKPDNLWKHQISSTQCLRWYINYFRIIYKNQNENLCRVSIS